MDEALNICPKCGQEMLLNWDADPMYFYHPVWGEQRVDPRCTNTVDYNDMVNT